MSEHDDLPRTQGVERLLERLASAAIHVAALAMLGLVAVQGWQVFARYVINDSPSWTEPLTVLLLSTAMSMGAAAAVHARRHFGFFLLGEHVGPVVRRLLEALSQAVVVAIGGVLAYWGWRLCLDGWDIRTAGAGFPQSTMYLPIAVGGALMALFALQRLVRAARGGAGTGRD